MPTRAAQRWDNGTLSEPVETAEGFLLVEGVLTRAGIFEYKKPDGTVRRELRDDAEVTDPASLATLLGRPTTLLHPVEDGKRVLVTPQNYSTFAAGSVVAPRVEEADGVPLVAAPLLWTRADALEAIRAGVRELSCGYECDLDETPGAHPIYGPYDAKQTGIVYNHVAAVPHGRAGRVAAMRLDAAEQQPTTEVEMPTDQKTDESAAPMFDAAKMDAYMGKMDAMCAKMDAILAKLMPAEGGEVEVEDAAKMDAADVVAYGNRRVELVATAKRLGIKHDAADDNNKIARAIATKHLGTLRADASDAYVDAVVDVASLNASAEATRKIGQQAAQTRHDSAAPTTQDYHAKLRANMRGTATKEG